MEYTHSDSDYFEKDNTLNRDKPLKSILKNTKNNTVPAPTPPLKGDGSAPLNGRGGTGAREELLTSNAEIPSSNVPEQSTKVKFNSIIKVKESDKYITDFCKESELTQEQKEFIDSQNPSLNNKVFSYDLKDKDIHYLMKVDGRKKSSIF